MPTPKPKTEEEIYQSLKVDENWIVECDNDSRALILTNNKIRKAIQAATLAAEQRITEQLSLIASKSQEGAYIQKYLEHRDKQSRLATLEEVERLTNELSVIDTLPNFLSVFRQKLSAMREIK